MNYESGNRSMNISMDRGPRPYVLNVSQAAEKNQDFRRTVWTGEHLQMTLMSIPVRGAIGWEIHEDTDQMIRIEQGRAVFQMGEGEGKKRFERELETEEAVFVPAGTWHNVMNAGRMPLKVSSIYAQPHHERGTVHRTRKDAAE